MKRKSSPLSPLNSGGPVRYAKRVTYPPGDDESLISLIARTASTNFLSIKDFMNEVVAPALDPKDSIGLLNWDNYSCVVGPNVHADRAIRALDSVTGQQDHVHFTFKPYEKLWTYQSLKLRQARVWCPDCYLEDIQSGKPAYDRLIWTVAAVTVCHRHHKVLHAKCLNCGMENERFHFTGYQPGICGYCGTWLSPLSARPLKEGQLGSFASWRTAAIHELLACRSSIDSLDSHHVAPCLKRVVDDLFAGKQIELARYLRISKGHLSDCILGKVVPAIDLLLLISYISQVPLVDFYAGSIDDGFMRLMPLPDAGMHRRAPRSALTPEIKARVSEVLSRIESGKELMRVLTWTDAARVAKVNIDTVRSVAGQSAPQISALFKSRRTEQSAWMHRAETQLIYEAIHAAFSHFQTIGRGVARRPIMAYVASTGAPARPRLHNWIYAMVLKERGKAGKHKTSGTGATPAASSDERGGL